MSAVQILLILALVTYAIVRRFLGSPVGARSMAIPVGLTAYGLYTLAGSLHGGVSAADIALIAGELVLGVAAGLGRGVTIRLYLRDGHLWQRYTVTTLLVWIAMIAVRVGFGLAGHAMGADLSVLGMSLLAFGASLVVESLVVARRAMATGAPVLPAPRRRIMAGIR